MTNGNFLGLSCPPAFMPHGHCYLWVPGILWLEVIAGMVIALAYYSIPLTLLRLMTGRRDIPYRRVFLVFGMFITACGTGHLIDILTIWHPLYWLKAYWNGLTAAVSIATALLLWRLMPRLLTAGTIEEVLQRRMVEELKTQKRELEQANARLAQSNCDLQEQMHVLNRATQVMAERETRIRELREELARGQGASTPGAS